MTSEDDTYMTHYGFSRSERPEILFFDIQCYLAMLKCSGISNHVC